MLKITLLAFVVSAVLCTVSAASAGWRVDLSPGSWKAAPRAVSSGQLPPTSGNLEGTAVRGKDAGSTSGYHVTGLRDGLEFGVTGKVTERRAMVWALDAVGKDLGAYGYWAVRYKANGLARDLSPVPMLSVVGPDDSGESVTTVLLDSGRLVNDGKWHTIVRKQKLDIKAERLEVRVGTDGSSASLVLDDLGFHPTPPRVSGFKYDRSWRKSKLPESGFRCLDLASLSNDSISAAYDRLLEGAEGCVVDGARSADSSISVGGVPFRVGGRMIRPSEDASANEETVEFLGAKVKRNSFFPIGRESRTEITVGMKTGEVFLLLVAEMPPTEGRYYVPTVPSEIEDIESIAVELHYADGGRDLAFPYSLEDEGFVVRRMLGAYAVPADSGRVLKSVNIFNRVFGRNIGVAAVTANTSGRRLLDKVWREPELVRVPALKPPAHREPFIKREGDSLKIGNTSCEMTVDLSRGFAITKVVNRWSGGTPIALDPSSGLEVEVGDKVLTGRDFSVEAVEDGRITLLSTEASVPLRLVMEISAGEEINFNLSAENTGQAPLKASIHFPLLKGVKIGKWEDTWLFFPQYRNVITNRKGFHRASNDRAFPVQFFDIYNPRAGVGLAFITHNLENLSVDYGALKDDSGASGYIRYPGEYYEMKPGETKRFVETALVAHSGDWHGALDAYKNWVSTWYKPVNSQDKDWYKESFLLRTHIVGEPASQRINHTPPLYDAESGVWHTGEVLEADRKYSGFLPDIFHFYCWEHAELPEHAMTGDWTPESYRALGGQEGFRSAIRTLQEGYGIPVSLYTLSDRVSKATEFGKKYGEKLVARRADGSALDSEDMWYLCPATKEWQEHYAESLKRVQQETGAKIIYLDVFSYTRGHYCYSPDHGHTVPVHSNQATLDMARRIREALPSDVAIWSEYVQPDVTSQYVDGFITYTFLTLHEHMVVSHDVGEPAPMYSEFAPDVHRFAFPGVKHFAFPVGIDKETSWGRLKQIFFNGESMYDPTWRLYDFRARELLERCLRIKKRYADCFTSDNPSMLVPTERAGVHANEFPGRSQTAWTIFNSRYTTVKGEVLALEHRYGDTYYDAWNNRPLTPRIEGNRAYISLELGPQALGCVVRRSSTGALK